MTTSTQVNKLKINKLTKEQFSSIIPSETELYFVTDEEDMLPSQEGHEGEYLTTDGTVSSWTTIAADEVLPSQTGESGKFLSTDGTNASWAEVQSGSSRNIGEIVVSTMPLVDAGLHLLDGSLIYHGAYSDFVDYMANYYNEAPEYSNVNIVGSLTDNNGVLSGFSATSYARLSIDFDVSDGSAWEAVYKVTTGSDVTTGQYFVGSLLSSNSHDPFVLGIYNNLFSAYINYDATSTSSVEIVSSVTPQPNTEYTMKLEFTGDAYNLYIDGVLEATVSSSTPVWTSNVILGTQSSSSGLSGPWLGSIDLNNSYMNINGSRWWTGRQPVGFTDELQWQAEIANYGVCGKFVYDSTNSTIRLPKYSNKIYSSAIDSTAPVVGNEKALGLTVGGSTYGNLASYSGGSYAFLYGNDSTTNNLNVGSSTTYSTANAFDNGKAVGVTTDGTKSGIISNLTNITTPLEGYYYVVIATVTKTSIQIDIDEVMTDLSNKANKDLSNVSWNSVSASDIPTDVELLSGSGTLTLEDNKLYKLTSSGSTTFSLPIITDTTKFHQIMVQLHMSSAITINAGTSYYFTDETPDISKAGDYDLIWEYDNVEGHWVFGAVLKGTA